MNLEDEKMDFRPFSKKKKFLRLHIKKGVLTKKNLFCLK